MRQAIYVIYISHRRMPVRYMACRCGVATPQLRSCDRCASSSAVWRVGGEKQITELEMIGSGDIVGINGVCASALVCSRIYVVRVGGLELAGRMWRVLGCCRCIVRV